MTTDAFQRIMAQVPSIDDPLDRLSCLKPEDREAIRALSAEIRRALEAIAIPEDLASAITSSHGSARKPPTPSDVLAGLRAADRVTSVDVTLRSTLLRSTLLHGATSISGLPVRL